MTHKSLFWSAIGSILLLSTSASAQFGGDAEIRPYAVLTLGIAFTPDLESETFAPLSSDISTENGPNLTIGGGIGAQWGYLNQELRVDYHRGEIASTTPALALVGVPVEDPSGKAMGVTTILYNVGLRQTFLDDVMAVYGAIGIGTAHAAIPIGATTLKDWQFGYAFSGGLFYDVWRGIGLDLGYRYVSAAEFSTELNTAPSAPSSKFTDGSFPFSVKWRVHEVILSLRYTWGGRD